MRHVVRGVSLGLALLAGSLRVEAQQSSTATYLDWVLECAIAQGPPPKKTCDIAQVTQVQGRNALFSRVSINTPPGKTKPSQLTVQVPVNVSLHASMSLLLDTGMKASTSFDVCIPGGCFANFAMEEDLARKFTAPNAAARLSFKDSTNHDVVLPISLKGFRSAYEALGKE